MKQAQKVPSGRVKRQPIGARGRLNVQGKDPEFHYRLVNDSGDRINQFVEAGYEMVTRADHRIGDNRVDVASSEGTHASVSVGVKSNGEPQRGYLMRIKNEWYEEDQKAKLANIQEQENQIKKPKIDGTYGEIKIS